MINDWLQHINFAYPWMLWLLLLVPLLALWYFFKSGNQQSSFKISSLAIYKKHSSGKTNLVHLPFVLRQEADFGKEIYKPLYPNIQPTHIKTYTTYKQDTH